MLLVGGCAVLACLALVVSTVLIKKANLVGGEAVAVHLFSGFLALLFGAVFFAVLGSSLLSIDEASADEVERLEVESVSTNQYGGYHVVLSDGREINFANKELICELDGNSGMYLVIHRRHVDSCFATVASYELVSEEGAQA